MSLTSSQTVARSRSSGGSSRLEVETCGGSSSNRLEAAADWRQRWRQQQTGGNRLEAAVEVEATDWRQQQYLDGLLEVLVR